MTPKAEPIVFLEAPEIFPNLKNPTSKTLFDGMILEKLVMFALYAGAESHQAKDIVHDRYLTIIPQVCDRCPDREWIIHHLTLDVQDYVWDFIGNSKIFDIQWWRSHQHVLVKVASAGEKHADVQ